MAKTASELLEEISEKLDVLISKSDTIIKLYTNSDTNIKILLNRMNKESKKEINNSDPIIEQVNLEEIKQSVEPLKVAGKQELPNDGNVRRTSRSEILEDSEFIEVKEKEILNKEVSVTQTVVIDNNKAAYIARVIIFKNSEKILNSADPLTLTKSELFIDEVKTNGVGRWQTRLKPGKYLVYIHKLERNTNTKYVSLSEIDVKDSAIPIDLGVCRLIKTKDSI